MSLTSQSTNIRQNALADSVYYPAGSHELSVPVNLNQLLARKFSIQKKSFVICSHTAPSLPDRSDISAGYLTSSPLDLALYRRIN